jgi:hypothetical protein
MAENMVSDYWPKSLTTAKLIKKGVLSFKLCSTKLTPDIDAVESTVANGPQRIESAKGLSTARVNCVKVKATFTRMCFLLKNTTARVLSCSMNGIACLTSGV